MSCLTQTLVLTIFIFSALCASVSETPFNNDQEGERTFSEIQTQPTLHGYAEEQPEIKTQTNVSKIIEFKPPKLKENGNKNTFSEIETFTLPSTPMLNSIDVINSYNVIEVNLTDLKVVVGNLNEQLKKNKRNLERSFEGTYFPTEIKVTPTEPARLPHQSSLAFVFDATGSMHDDLVQLREGADLILNAMLERPDNPIYNYILIPFRDPDVGPLIVTRDHNKIREELSRIEIAGGVDCPEKSLTAITMALNASLPYSYIYVFTDASATDYLIVDKVLNMVQRKHSQIVFVLTGYCEDRSKPHYKVYEKIAEASSGQIFHLNKTDVHKVLEYVKESVDARRVNLDSFTNPPGKSNDRQLSIDATLDQVTISVSGKEPQISVKDPSGNKFDGPPKLMPVLELSEIKIININDLYPGNWTIVTGSTEEHTVKVTGISNVKFGYAFSVNSTTNIIETSQRPLQDTINNMLVWMDGQSEEVDSIKYVEILKPNGELYFEVPLTKINETELFKAEPFLPPSEIFLLAFNGIDRNGNTFRRLSSNGVQPQSPGKPLITLDDSIEANLYSSPTLRCRVESLVPITVWWFKNGVPVMNKQERIQSAIIEYTIPSLNSSTEGKYDCKALNSAGSSMGSINVSIIGLPPKITIHPENGIIQSNVNFSISCDVESDSTIVDFKMLFKYNHHGFNQIESLEPIHKRMSETLSSYEYISISSSKDEGTYICIAINKDGKSETVGSLRVLPEIKIQVFPRILEFFSGDPLGLSCRIYGTAFGEWSIQKDGWEPLLITNESLNWELTSIPMEDTGVQLLIDVKNSTRELEGNYLCSAIRDGQPHEHAVSKLVYIEKPKILLELTDVEVENGKIGILECDATGVPAPDITWTLPDATKTSASNQIRKDILVNEENKLIIHDANEMHEGIYTCEASNQYGSTSAEIRFSVWSKPELVEEIHNQTAEIYESKTFTCHFYGLPEPDIFWYHKDSLIENMNLLSDNNHSLTISMNDVNMEGKYACVGKNKYGSYEHDFFVEIVGLEAPVLLHGNKTVIVKEGRLLEISCRYLEGKPLPFLYWQRNGINLTDPLAFGRNRNNIYYENDLSDRPLHSSNISLYFDNVMVQNDDVYSCIAVNSVGLDNYTFHLEVQSPPKINKNRLRFSVEEDEDEFDPYFVLTEHLDFIKGDKVELDCGVLGKPKPLVVWSKNHNPVIYSEHLYNRDNMLIFPSINENDDGLYTCDASNAMGSIHRNFSLTVLVRPYIENSEFEIVQKISGQLVTLPCKGFGIPFPETVWYFNETVLESTDILQLDLSNTLRLIANSSKAGFYVCKVYNKIGNASKTYRLDVYDPPVISNSLNETILTSVGSNISINCEAYGYPKPSITWKQNNETIANISKDFIYEESGQLFIIDVSYENSNPITCLAQNEVGMTEKTYFITLYEPPRILPNNISQNIQLTVNEGELIIPCQAAGHPNPVISWYKDGQLILNNIHTHVGFDGSLTLRFIIEDMSGNYSCQANNSEGSAEAHFQLDIMAPPKLVESTEDGQTVILKEGDSIALECPIKQSIVSPKINWYKNSTFIGLTNQTLVLENVTRKSDFSEYKCVASNKIGNTSWTFNLNVHWPPKFIDSNETDIQKINLLEDESLKLVCNVDSNPPSDIQWMRNLEIVGDVSQIYEIQNIKTHHSGEYICVATNSIGQSIKKFNISVSVPPKFESLEIENIKVRIGQSVQLNCEPSGYPKPQIEWTIKYAPDWTVLKNSLKSFNVSKKSEGLYHCNATNNAGIVSKSFNISILESPSVPFVKVLVNGVESKQDKKNIFTIKANENVAMYCLSNENSSLMWIKHGSIINSTKNSEKVTLNFEKVRLKDSGRYYCISRNKVGLEEISIAIQVIEKPKIFVDDFYKLFDSSESDITNKSSPQEVDVIEGHMLNINCFAKGSPFPDIYWMKNGKIIELNNNIISEENNQVLTIKSISKSDAGNYSCIVKNIAGEQQKFFNVNVLVAPYVEQMRDQGIFVESKANQQIHLDCLVNGNPSPKIKWLKHPFHDLTNQQHENILIKDGNKSLIIKKSSVKDNGKYTCIASNKIGVTEVTYTVEVIDPPELITDGYLDKMPIINNDGVMYVKIKRDFILICNATGHPEPTFKWYKNNKYIPNHHKRLDRTHISLDGRYLHIMDTNLNDSGSYTCLAENKAGRKERTFAVKIIIPGEWSLWSHWSECSVSCGYGISFRSRKCTFEDAVLLYNLTGYDIASTNLEHHFDKSSCVGQNKLSKPCFNRPCMVDGGWSEWSNWTTCSIKCGKGVRRRYRSCSNPHPAFGGHMCNGTDSQQEHCTGENCAPWLPWSSWSSCSVTCGKGKRVRARVCSSSEGNCNGLSKEHSECVMPKCSVDGGWSEWSEWSPCSCSSGYRARHRQCNNPIPTGNGRNCEGGNHQIAKCHNTKLCSNKQYENRSLVDYFEKDDKNINKTTIIAPSLNEVLSERDHYSPHSTFVINPILESTHQDNIVEANLPDDAEMIDFFTGEPYKFNRELVKSSTHCPKGYKLNAITMKCEDLNECLLYDNGCHSTQMCENIIGSYKCFCQNGYQSLGIGQRCLDINECLLDIHGCSHECVNIPGGYLCVCPKNHILAADKKTCYKDKISSPVPTMHSYKQHKPKKQDEDVENILLTRISPKKSGDNKRRIPRPHKHKFDDYEDVDYGVELNSRKYLSPIDEQFISPSANRRFSKHTNWKDTFFLENSFEDQTFAESRRSAKLRTWDDKVDFMDNCPTGQHFYNGRCTDIDECSLNMDNCDGVTNICVNIQDSYMCVPTPCPSHYNRISNGSCEQICDTKDAFCSERAALKQSLIYLSYSTSKSDATLPGKISELNFGGYKSRTKYTLESQPPGEAFEVSTDENRGIIYAKTIPSLNHINMIVITSRTYDEREVKLLYFNKYIIYIYITE